MLRLFLLPLFIIALTGFTTADPDNADVLSLTNTTFYDVEKVEVPLFNMKIESSQESQCLLFITHAKPDYVRNEVAPGDFENFEDSYRVKSNAQVNTLKEKFEICYSPGEPVVMQNFLTALKEKNLIDNDKIEDMTRGSRGKTKGNTNPNIGSIRTSLEKRLHRTFKKHGIKIDDDRFYHRVKYYREMEFVIPEGNEIDYQSVGSYYKDSEVDRYLEAMQPYWTLMDILSDYATDLNALK